MRGHDLINTLPDEVLAQVLSYIDALDDRNSCSLVCKRWSMLEQETRRSLQIGVAEGEFNLSLLLLRFTGLRDVSLDGQLCSRHLPQYTHKSLLRKGDPLQVGFLGIMYKASNDRGGVSWAGLTVLGQTCPKLENLRLRWCLGDNSSSGFQSLVVNCPGLRSLEFDTCYLGDEILQTVGKFDRLKSLTVFNSDGFTEVGLLAAIHGSLRELSLRDAKVTSATIEAIGLRCSLLEKLELDLDMRGRHNRCFQAITKGCPKLRDVRIFQCYRFVLQEQLVHTAQLQSLETIMLHHFTYDDESSAIAQCHRLKSLTLQGCNDFTSKTLAAIGRGCTELSSLTIDGCRMISFEGYRAIGSFRKLKELTVIRSETINNSSMSQIARNCNILRELVLVDCPRIGDSSIVNAVRGCPDLRKIHLDSSTHWLGQYGDKAIVAVGKYCKKLEEFSMRYSARVSDVGLKAMAAGCQNLERLYMSGCPRLQDIGISAIAKGCQKLTHLDIYWCEGITFAELDGEFPSLKDINMSWCDNVCDKGVAKLAAACPKVENCEIVFCPEVMPWGIASATTGFRRLRRLYVEFGKATSRTERRFADILDFEYNYMDGLSLM